MQTAPSWHSEAVRGPWGEACHSQARLQLDCSALLCPGLAWVTTLLSVLLCSSLLLSALARGETPVAETQSSVLGGKGKCLHLCFRILLSIFTKILLEFFFGYQHLIDLSPPLRYIFQWIFSLPWTLQTGRCDQLLRQRLPYNQPIRGRLLPGDRPQHGGVGLGGEQAQPGLDKGAVTQ